MSVKTLDEVEIVVEGRVQRKVGNTTSTKSFKRTFILPDIVPESITSVVSSDGVLIIKALKKVGYLTAVFGTLKHRHDIYLNKFKHMIYFPSFRAILFIIIMIIIIIAIIILFIAIIIVI